MSNPSSVVEVRLADAGGPAQLVALGARLPRFVGCKIDPVAALLTLKIMLVGVGSVGRNAALHLARLQPHTLWLVDPKRYKLESLATQAIDPAEVGAPKAASTARLCKRISPATRVFSFTGLAEALPLAAFAEADVFLITPDNLPAVAFVGQVARNLGKLLIQAAVQGEVLVAQVSCWSNARVEGPCPVCGFTSADWAHVNAATRFSCEGVRTGESRREVFGPATMSVSPLCSLAADLAVTQLLRSALRLGAPVEDSALEYCGYTHRTVVAPLKFNPQCPCDHTIFARRAAPKPLGECSLRDLSSTAGLPFGEAASFTVDGFSFVEFGACQCANPPAIRRFVASGETSIGSCGVCGAPVQAQPFHTHRSVSAPLLGPLAERPLRELGAAAARSVVVRAAEAAGLISNSHSEPATP